jgi:hypothetical protein
MIDDDGFLAEFEACRWPIEQWHHQQHIKLAYLEFVPKTGFFSFNAKQLR